MTQHQWRNTPVDVQRFVCDVCEFIVICGPEHLPTNGCSGVAAGDTNMTLHQWRRNSPTDPTRLVCAVCEAVTFVLPDVTFKMGECSGVPRVHGELNYRLATLRAEAALQDLILRADVLAEAIMALTKHPAFVRIHPDLRSAAREVGGGHALLEAALEQYKKA